MGKRAACVTLTELKNAQAAGMAIEVMPDGRILFYPWQVDIIRLPANIAALDFVDKLRL